MSRLAIRPVTPALGAEVDGVTLAEPLDDGCRDEILAALDKHLVLFFREQHITPEQQLAFATRFGPVSVAPFGPKDAANPDITVLDQLAPKGEGADRWHADNTFMPEPPFASILRGERIPALGGDTCWANTFLAYEGLSAPVREMIDGLQAVHDITKMLVKAIEIGKSDANVAEMQQRWPPFRHPVVRRHPATGRKALNVNRNWTTRIDGLGERESAALLDLLCDQMLVPDYQVRLRWSPGTVAFWDNRWVQHYAVPDYTERRVMCRVTLAGERPE
ncbi:MAG TPA: TauD/TfdA family dioxygenase [Frankiaceae bacterium]|nr:TauD/TfdA family dioxygenase [Frankiaceae bacterium]